MEQFKMMARANGHEVPDDDEEESTIPDKGDEDLPEELLAMEREYQERKAKRQTNEGAVNDLFAGIGHVRVKELE